MLAKGDVMKLKEVEKLHLYMALNFLSQQNAEAKYLTNLQNTK
jgi:hypothetical protein